MRPPPEGGRALPVKLPNLIVDCPAPMSPKTDVRHANGLDAGVPLPLKVPLSQASNPRVPSPRAWFPPFVERIDYIAARALRRPGMGLSRRTSNFLVRDASTAG